MRPLRPASIQCGDAPATLAEAPQTDWHDPCNLTPTRFIRAAGVINVSKWRALSSCVLALLAIAAAAPASAQLNAQRGSVALTLEGYANLTSGYADLRVPEDPFEDGNLRVDAALRALARWSNPGGPDIGLRVALESSPEEELDVAEASVLIFGRGGRLEIGDRQGLPDVLLGYAPNNFTFTGAEFGPASGPSLDPGGGLQTAFLDAPLATQIRELAVLGFAASLSDDRSAKIVYVSPKARGWIAGVSYASNATDPRFNDLVQLGLTHDTYWGENVLHVGGSYSFARAVIRPRLAESGAPRRDLNSVSAGATLVLHNDWMLGASVTYDGTSGLTSPALTDRSQSDAWGAVVSLNYNHGPWTAGAFIQRGRREGDVNQTGDDALTAFEAGLSYRISTKFRLYGAWYAFDFDDEGGVRSADRHRGQLLLFGLRAAL